MREFRRGWAQLRQVPNNFRSKADVCATKRKVVSGAVCWAEEQQQFKEFED